MTRVAKGTVWTWMEQYVREVTMESECTDWPWARNKVTGRASAFNPRVGYCQMAGRVTWEMLHQQPFPGGMEAMHTCHNGHLGCANPHHITPGTRAQNEADRAALGRTKGERNPHAGMTEAQVRAACERMVRGEQIKLVARDLNVSYEGLLKVWAGESWQHLDVPRRDTTLTRPCDWCGKPVSFAGSKRKFCDETCSQAQRSSRRRLAAYVEGR